MSSNAFVEPALSEDSISGSQVLFAVQAFFL
jgi:hypothetical protein